MASLQNLKKQAKALVRLHREGSYHLACVARETLPQFAHLSDREVLAADFKLADALTLLARQHGCEDWDALRRQIAASEPTKGSQRREGTTSSREPLFAVPMLYVADVRRAVAYYADVLGFTAGQVSGDPPFFAEVYRGGAALALRFVHASVIDPQARARETMLLQAAIRVPNAKALYLEFLAKGAKFNASLYREPWGPHGFVVEDGDGNLIGFGEPGPGAKGRARLASE